MNIVLTNLLEPAKTKEEAIRRLTSLAAIAALACSLFLLAFFTVPTWVELEFIPKFQVLFLTFTAISALVSVGMLGAVALIKRGIY